MVNKKLFREYIGAMDKGVTLDNVPVTSDLDFHFILSFSVDYTNTIPPAPANGQFGVFWDTVNLTPHAILAMKQGNPNVKFAIALGGDSVNGEDNHVFFNADSVDSWVSNAVATLTPIMSQYHITGIDIDYEHFSDVDVNDPTTFTECIGQLITTLKQEGTISFASIAPYNNPTVQNMYMALWQRYKGVIDYINFQFYANDPKTTMDEYIRYYNEQEANYDPEKIIASFSTGTGRVISPDVGMTACQTLKSQNRLNGIFIWSADASLVLGNFEYESQAQELLAQ